MKGNIKMPNQQELFSRTLTRDQMMSRIAHGYCDERIRQNAPIPTPEEIASAIAGKIHTVCRMVNNSHKKGERWKLVDGLDHMRIAICLAELNLVRQVQLNDDEDEKSYMLGIYETDGPKHGLYNIDENAINPLVRAFSGACSSATAPGARQCCGNRKSHKIARTVSKNILCGIIHSKARAKPLSRAIFAGAIRPEIRKWRIL